jgi:hypothetical protein
MDGAAARALPARTLQLLLLMPQQTPMLPGQQGLQSSWLHHSLLLQQLLLLRGCVLLLREAASGPCLAGLQ